MDGGGEELGDGGFGLGEFGFQGVAQGQQLGDLGDDSLLLGEWRDGQHDPPISVLLIFFTPEVVRMGPSI